MKVFSLVASSLAIASAATCKPTGYPTTKVGGIEVIDTPIVRDARKIVEKFTPYLYKHVMRTWLFGAAILNHNATLKAEVDVEVHAIATLLHDLGWDMTPGSPWVTTTRRFEIDGALGAKKFVTSHRDAKQFDAWRLENLQDGIRLHGSFDLEIGKPATVQHIVTSIHLDNPKVPYPISNKELNSIFAAFPNFDIAAGANETFVWMATIKPEVTYGTIIEQFGAAWVPGYNATGHHAFDSITNAILTNTSWVPRPE
ncbi:hypothetical protein F5Y17DRAFT_465025 [Xylariaceae sp. FL0594]|nr:hypothetical protein F5Y17DRAFT_465025 [Xylariaceae sp. FL0594]